MAAEKKKVTEDEMMDFEKYRKEHEGEIVENEADTLRYLNQKKKEEGLDKAETWEYQNLLRKYGDPDTWQDENINDDEEDYYDDYEDEDWDDEEDWDDYEDDVDESNYDPYLGQDVYDDGDSWINESKRCHNRLRERDYKEIYECRYAAKKLLDEGRVWGISAVKFGNIPVEIAQDCFFLKFDLPNNVYERIVESPLFFKSKEEAEQYIKDQELNKTCDSTQIVNETEFLRDVISGRLDRFISVAEKKDYARKHYLDDPIDKSADLGNVRYMGDDLGVPQYESAKRSSHWYEKLEGHFQEAQASDETFKKFWDLAEEEYGIN